MRLKTVLGVILLFTVVCVTALAANRGNTEKGKTLYAGKCAICHGPSGEGKEAMAKALKVEFRSLGSKEVQAKTDAELGRMITEGTGKMKPVKLTSEELADVTAYLRALAKK